MLVLYAGLGRETAADYDHRSCILSGASLLQAGMTKVFSKKRVFPVNFCYFFETLSCIIPLLTMNETQRIYNSWKTIQKSKNLCALKVPYNRLCKICDPVRGPPILGLFSCFLKDALVSIYFNTLIKRQTQVCFIKLLQLSLRQVL
jgi:hypothetical protein